MGKRCKLLLLVMTALSALNGCSSMNNTEKDALIGGGFGAGLGALLDRRHPGTGAAVGGLIGAGTGALVGNSEDKAEARAKAQAAAAAAPVRGPLSMEEVATMAKSGVSDSVIINQIRTSGTRYNLSGEMIIWLQQNNVSEAVIREMQDTNRRYYGRPVVVQDGPTVIYDRGPYYYGPPVVGVGVYGRIR
ncbi:MAG: YMGG-like glycine zipper-containing protein [Gemmataceae bacterium]